MQFWAKTSRDGEPGVSVYDHMVDVGSVARAIAQRAPWVLEHFDLSLPQVAALVALHDIGKISPGFQRKSNRWLVENNLSAIDRNGCWDTSTEPDHGKVSHSAIQDYLVQRGARSDIAKYVAAALGAHHGRLKFYPNDRGIRPPLGIRQVAEPSSGVDWHGERMSHAERVWRHFRATDVPSTLGGESHATWWLAGLASVADWIGSDERFFPPDHRTADFDAGAAAALALDSIGLITPSIKDGLTFEEIFGFHPNGIQRAALENISGPGVYVIEAPMGTGKTEAALGAAYELLRKGKANGIYFALPTQSTSNRIHRRLNEFLDRIAPTAGASKLIHGNSWLLREDADFQPAASGTNARWSEDARGGRDWFASGKRALLAPFGVGTIDQALLGVVAAKHFFVRHFALAGKVVILDEIHSYDIYTGTLVDALIETLEALNCTVIVLSATLTGKRRDKIVTSGGSGRFGEDLPYPLISSRVGGIVARCAPAAPGGSLQVKVDFAQSDHALNDTVTAARQGAAVLWICDTVDAAQQQFQRIGEAAKGAFPIGLLHSRFPFWRREQLEGLWMERFGKEGVGRCGSILVSTQVVEQSVDLDADLLVTELAPTDMLLQRLGRLWRHQGRTRPIDRARICLLDQMEPIRTLREMGAPKIKAVFGSKALVYSPYVLLRALEVWKNLVEVSIPDQIRSLLEATYGEREDEPESWQTLRNEEWGRAVALRQAALSSSNVWQPPLDDQEGVQTRINEIETVSIVLCREITSRSVLFVDGTGATLENRKYMHATARALHRNVVKFPSHHFRRVEPLPAFEQYFSENHLFGMVQDDGEVRVDGLKAGSQLIYSDEIGLRIGELTTGVTG